MVANPQNGHEARISDEEAEIVALHAVAFIAADSDAVAGFLRMTGLEPADLAQGLGDRRFLAAVLAFLLENEARLLKFCGEHDMAPAVPAAARRRLDPESESPTWT